MGLRRLHLDIRAPSNLFMAIAFAPHRRFSVCGMPADLARRAAEVSTSMAAEAVTEKGALNFFSKFVPKEEKAK